MLHWRGLNAYAVRGPLALAGVALLLASCAAKQAATPPPKLETIVVPLPEDPKPVEPEPPVQITQSKAEDLWHLRSALNVAALICAPATYGQLTPGYNQMLRSHKALLASAVQVELDQFKARDSKKWQANYDTHMTKVYNVYSLTQQRVAFCEAATLIVTEAGTASADTMQARATAMLFKINRAAQVIEPTVQPMAAATPPVKPVR